MNLYAVTYIDDAPDDGSPPGPKVQWFGTMADEAKATRALKAAHMVNIQGHTVQVPTSKAALLAWLNERGVRP